MKQWKQIAHASGFGIPDIERIIPSLDALEAIFRPLATSIPHDVEPAVIFHAIEDEAAEGSR